MLKALIPMTAALLLILDPSQASAQIGGPAFSFVSQASGNCLTLSAPDQSDGGALTTAPRQNFANFFVTVVGNTGGAVLQFRLNSTRFVCIYSTETPVGQPSDHRAKVSARNCASPPTRYPGQKYVERPRSRQQRLPANLENERLRLLGFLHA
jgi:hypothetical protein